MLFSCLKDLEPFVSSDYIVQIIWDLCQGIFVRSIHLMHSLCYCPYPHGAASIEAGSFGTGDYTALQMASERPRIGTFIGPWVCPDLASILSLSITILSGVTVISSLFYILIGIALHQCCRQNLVLRPKEVCFDTWKLLQNKNQLVLWVLCDYFLSKLLQQTNTATCCLIFH